MTTAAERVLNEQKPHDELALYDPPFRSGVEYNLELAWVHATPNISPAWSLEAVPSHRWPFPERGWLSNIRPSERPERVDHMIGIGTEYKKELISAATEQALPGSDRIFERNDANFYNALGRLRRLVLFVREESDIFRSAHTIMQAAGTIDRMTEQAAIRMLQDYVRLSQIQVETMVQTLFDVVEPYEERTGTKVAPFFIFRGRPPRGREHHEVFSLKEAYFMMQSHRLETEQARAQVVKACEVFVLEFFGESGLCIA